MIAGSSRRASRGFAAGLLLALTVACGGASGGARSQRPAPEILAAASAQLERTGSYHVAGMIDPGVSLDMVVWREGLAGTVTTHGVSWQLLLSGTRLWFKGAALWRATVAAATAARLGDGWVEVQDFGAGFGLAGAFVHLREALVHEVFGPHSGLKVTGTVTLGGRKAVELAGPKDVYDVALDGPAYPLRWLDRDIPGPGGRPCGITLDSFESAAPVPAPSPVVGTLAPGSVPNATPTPIVAG